MPWSRSFRKDADRAHHRSVSCMPNTHVDSNPFFALDPLRAGSIFWADLAHMAIPSSQCCLLPSWCRLVVNALSGWGISTEFLLLPQQVHTNIPDLQRSVWADSQPFLTFRFWDFGFLPVRCKRRAWITSGEKQNCSWFSYFGDASFKTIGWKSRQWCKEKAFFLVVFYKTREWTVLWMEEGLRWTPDFSLIWSFSDPRG